MWVYAIGVVINNIFSDKQQDYMIQLFMLTLLETLIGGILSLSYLRKYNRLSEKFKENEIKDIEEQRLEAKKLLEKQSFSMSQVWD